MNLTYSEIEAKLFGDIATTTIVSVESGELIFFISLKNDS